MAGLTDRARINSTWQAIRWGRLVVLNPDGSVNREEILTQAQTQHIASSAKWDASYPCTQREWEEQIPALRAARASVKFHALREGDMEVKRDGSMTLCVLVNAVGSRVEMAHWRLAPGDWTGTPPDINVSRTVCAANEAEMGGVVSTRQTIDRIQLGVVRTA